MSQPDRNLSGDTRAPIEVNLQQARVFLVLGEELHFGRTADRLLLSQPYASRTLAALERHVGGRLVERSSRRVRLTALGASFHADLTAAWGALTLAFEHASMTASGASGVLIIGCTSTTAGAPLSALIAQFEVDHPEYEVRVRELPPTHPFEALEAGKVDVLVFWQPTDEPHLETGAVIDRQQRVLAMRRGHPLSTRDSVTMEDVADYGMPDMANVAGPASIEQAIWPATTPSGRTVPRVGPPSRTMSELADAIARSDAVKPTVESFAQAVGSRGDLAFKPLAGLPPLQLCPIWLSTHSARPAIRALAASSRAVAGPQRSPDPASRLGKTNIPVRTDPSTVPSHPGRRGAWGGRDDV